MTPAWVLERTRGAATRIRFGWPRLLELFLLGLLIVQLVRLVWIAVTPTGPIGDWRGRAASIPLPAARAALFRSFDAFYPAPVASSAQNVTSLALTLFGVRVNEGSGLGSAIIAGEDDVQGSYAVGDEIQPGVTLKSVGFDHVVIDRGGVEEMLYLDQSVPVTPVAPPAPAAQAAVPDTAALSPQRLQAEIGVTPQMNGSKITGLLVSSKGPAFAAAGFRDGDVITRINGRPVSSASDLSDFQRLLVPGAHVSLMVERGATTVPIAIAVPAT